MDLQHGYWQVELEEHDREKTAFTTGSGLYHFKVMPMGLTNAPATCQRLMEMVLRGLPWKMCLVYLDDCAKLAYPTDCDRDASCTAVGAVLGQKQEQTEKVVAYASHVLTKAEKRCFVAPPKGPSSCRTGCHRRSPVPQQRAPMKTIVATEPFQKVAADILELPITTRGNSCSATYSPWKTDNIWPPPWTPALLPGCTSNSCESKHCSLIQAVAALTTPPQLTRGGQGQVSEEQRMRRAPPEAIRSADEVH
uniref:ribonuclease H n=1 Tax=Knipowitschia caucasica TaxID=637954 RepID=A0AAV2JGA7_KNICA